MEQGDHHGHRGRLRCYTFGVSGSAEKQRQKGIEFACIEAVARTGGWRAVAADEANQWPDGWLEHYGTREPVEVVAAFRRTAGEEPKKGSSWLRSWKRGATVARALSEKTGEAVSWHVGEDGFLVLDGTTELPLAPTPIRQNEWVLHAVQKIAKNYASGPPAILIVQLDSPLPLTRFEIEQLAEALRALATRFTFAALWVVNDYGDPPVKIPM